MATPIFVHQKPTFESKLRAVKDSYGRPKLPNWFWFPQDEEGDEKLFQVSDKTAHLFVLYSEYVIGYIEHCLGQAPKPDEQESRIVGDIWFLHTKGVLESYFKKEMSDEELERYEIREDWWMVKTNIPPTIQE